MNRTSNRKWLVAAVVVTAFLAVSPIYALGTPANTDITNQATVTYDDSLGNNFTSLSNVVTTTVSQVAAVDIDPDRAGSGTPNTSVAYAHTVTNNGNGDDTFNLTEVSSQGWTVTYYLDDGDGIFNAGDTLLTDTDADTDPDTGVMSADAVLDIWVVVDIPAGTPGATVDTTTVTATSAFDGAVSDFITDTTTVNAPGLTVTKSVNPPGNQPPTTLLTYTIMVTNTGNADALNVLMTDDVPANTQYVAESITVNAVAEDDDMTDGSGYDAGGGVTGEGQVSLDLGSVAQGATVTIEFQVTIR